MTYIFCVIGKSSTGKDTVFDLLLNDSSLSLQKIVTYTTRPIRAGETDGREYFFVDEDEEERLSKEGKIIERRSYDTVYGKWDYFTVNDGQIEVSEGQDKCYIVIATLESFARLKDFYKNVKVVPIYIYVEDGLRLLLERRHEVVRHVVQEPPQSEAAREKREHRQEVPRYDEMCRRYLGDMKDFSDEKLKECGIDHYFENEDSQRTADEIASYIRSVQRGG